MRPAPNLLRIIALFASAVLVALVYPQSQVRVGYAILTADSGTTLPVGSLLFSTRNEHGSLVSQAAVGGVDPITQGRIYVAEGGTRTGMALVNPGMVDASVTLTLRDSAGREVGRQGLALKAGGYLARYVGELFAGLASGFRGSLTFASSAPVAAITLRENRNALEQAVYATLPVVDLNAPGTTQPLIFPQVAAGGGYRTQLVLMNATGERQRGRIRFTGSDGRPLVLQAQGGAGSEFGYEMEAGGTYEAEYDRAEGLAAGYAVVTAEGGGISPAGTAIFQVWSGGRVATEAGVGVAAMTTAARLFVDQVGTKTGVAVANPNLQSAELTIRLRDRYGQTLESKKQVLEAGKHLAVFSDQLFPLVSGAFTGVLEISGSRPVAVVSLKVTVNDAQEVVLTTVPVADGPRRVGGSVVFPHWVTGGGYGTQAMLVNPDRERGAAGRLQFYDRDGKAMVMPLGSRSGSEYRCELEAGGGSQLYPGETAGVAELRLVDPYTYRVGTEVAVSVGETIRIPTAVLDVAGRVREEFELTYGSLSSGVATVDAAGRVTGKREGFSTLRVTGGGKVATGTITVVKVESGAGGYQIAGMTQDLGGRLYLANAEQHTILRAENVRAAPSVYAGVTRTPGLKNDVRLQSWFRNPSSLALDQSTGGGLYVADTENHVIRHIQLDTADRVASIAGSGAPGLRDGAGLQAMFHAPQGVALDRLGRLWVTDTGNHTIRRIEIQEGTEPREWKVVTVAGGAGLPGADDGIGAGARFNSPTGIAVEHETIAEQLARTKRGEPAPPVTVVVADTGNGLVRRIKETGEVETLRTSPSGMAVHELGPAIRSESAASGLKFHAPKGIAVDPQGNIYLVEPQLHRVQTILRNGNVAAAIQAGVLNAPEGITALESGKIIVTDAAWITRAIEFGAPQILGILPEKVGNRVNEKVILQGANFAPESMVIIGGMAIPSCTVRDTQTIELTLPGLPSGLSTVTVQNRAGMAQKAFPIYPVPIKELPKGTISTFAGGNSYYRGDGLPAISAELRAVGQIALDNAGNLLVADKGNHRVRRVERSTGVITTVAGTGEEPDNDFPQREGVPALAMRLYSPAGVAMTPTGNLIIADEGTGKIIAVSANTGVTSIIAGKGTASLGDGGPAEQANLYYPGWLAVDRQGNIFVNDSGHSRIRKIDARSGVIRTVAGNGESAFSKDNILAINASLTAPTAITLDALGNIYIAESSHFDWLTYWTHDSRVRKVNASTGIITTMAGTGRVGFSGDGGLATSAELSDPQGISVAPEGHLYISDTGNQRLRKVDASTGIISTVAGTGQCGDGRDGDFALQSPLCAPAGIVNSASGIIDFAAGGNRIQHIDLGNGTLSTLAGSKADFSGNNGPAALATLKQLSGGMCFDPSRNLYFADYQSVRRILAATGDIKTVYKLAGNADLSSFNAAGLACDSAGNVFLTSRFSVTRSEVHKLDFTVMKATVVREMPTQLYGLDLDAAGDLLIADAGNDIILKMNTRTGDTVPFIGGGNAEQDNVPARQARLQTPMGVLIDRSGNVFISELDAHRIRKWNVSSGLVSIFAGTGAPGFSGDGGPARAAQLFRPQTLAMDGAGNLFIADVGNNVIRKVAADTGTIITVAGDGKIPEKLGDNEPAIAVSLMLNDTNRALAPDYVRFYFFGMTLDAEGNLYLSDDLHKRIRVISGAGARR